MNTANALFAACLAARKSDRLCWGVLADFVRDAVADSPVTATAGGKTLRVKRFAGSMYQVTVNHAGAVVRDVTLADWLRQFAVKENA